jgi:hypothetical protein
MRKPPWRTDSANWLHSNSLAVRSAKRIASEFSNARHRVALGNSYGRLEGAEIVVVRFARRERDKGMGLFPSLVSGKTAVAGMSG